MQWKLQKTTLELEEILEQLAYHDYCVAQSGGENVCGSCKFSLLKELFNLPEDFDLYALGHTLYNNGVRYDWDTATRKYKKTIKCHS